MKSINNKSWPCNETQQVIVGDYFKKLENIMQQNNFFNQPRMIFNMDEKGCRLTFHHQQQVLAGRETKQVHMIALEHRKCDYCGMCKCS